MNTRYKTRTRGNTASAIIATILMFCLSAPLASEGAGDFGKREVDIATVNLYIGSDFAPVLSLDPADPNFGAKLVGGVATIYARIQQSNFQARANALARQIVARGPDLVALQEVSLIRRQSPGDAIVGGTIPATQIDMDYLKILMDALRRNGGHYEVVSQVQDVDVELPLMTGPGAFDDVRLTDRDVIIARTDLPPGHLRTYNATSSNFTARLPLPIGVTILRGWCSVDVQVRGRSLRFISTHLEDALPAGLPNIQLAQAAELLQGPANTNLPVVLAGDFNSDAYGRYSPEAYSLLTGRGRLSDLWTEVGGRSRGLTWGHDEFLSDITMAFTLRLDLVLFRGGGLEADQAVVVDPIIRVTPPRWFSDHAGLFGSIRIK